MPSPKTFTVLVVLGLLSACSHKPKGTPDNEPTLKTLASRTVDVQPDHALKATPEQAIAAYRGFLDIAPSAKQREEAMRRMGDLEMDRADIASEDPQASGAPDYRAAVTRYQELLKTFPNSPGNDRVLYQLARAQEQGGDLGAALKTLDRLVAEYPQTGALVEAQFRRGELLFTQQDYVKAEAAYTTVLATEGGRFHDRALYMQGWSRFKQGKLEEALQSFFGVLDAKLAALDGENTEDDLQSLSRADRELVEDTLRVTSLSLANLQGAESIAPYINTPERQVYAYKVYEQLGELYLKQERIKDAADTWALFARQRPLDTQAPLFQSRVIAIYERNGFANLALEAKKDYVVRYGQASALRQAKPSVWQKAQPLVQTHLAELARHYHAQAQTSKQSADYQQAVHWYREYLTAFPADPQAARNNFLLAELLFEDRQYAEAATEYEKTAYGYDKHADSADAGYGALLAYAKQQPAAQPQTAVDSALRFVQAFANDSRAAPVLADAAEKLYALKQPERAATAAQQLLDLNPPPAQRRVAWTVLAQTRFEANDFPGSEQAYAEVLALTPEGDAGRAALVERRAAAMYKQGELARVNGDTGAALAHFERAARTAGPQSQVQVAALYDTAAAQLVLKDWAGATRSLEDFRRRYPNSPLQAELPEKLALAYGEQGQWAAAAGEYERMAATQKDPALARAALWQAATLQDKAAGNAGAAPAAARLYARYLSLYPQPLEPALEARWALARMAKAEGNSAKQLALLKDLQQAEQADTAANHSPRARFLAASATLALAEPVADAYRKIALVEPLQRQLKNKKAKMEEALAAYAAATNYGVADVSTEASYRIATVYRDFGKALMASERPKKLNKLEREQYGVMLEEQAYPFEEKATEIHMLNAKRAATGLYDPWVRSSFDALRELLPVRYGKTERSEGASTSAEAQALNQQGIAKRQAGAFAEARSAYEQAISKDANYRSAVLNLGILQDLYLGDAPAAQSQYERYLALTPEGDATVTKWLAEIKNRKEKP